MNRKKKVILGAALAIAGVATATGVAVAVWTVSGTGSGGAGATVAQSLTATVVTPTGSAATLYPGGPAATIYLQIANPNPFAVKVTAITYGTPTSNNTTVCASANISIDSGAPATLNTSIAANSNSGTVAVAGVLDMLHSAPDGCQGVTFNVPVTLSGVQQ